MRVSTCQFIAIYGIFVKKNKSESTWKGIQDYLVE
jgi:hypothetical protein